MASTPTPLTTGKSLSTDLPAWPDGGRTRTVILWWSAMSVASVLFDVLGPVVLLVALGAVVGPALGIDARSLSRLAYWVLGPAFMFDVLADAALERRVMLQLGAAGLAGMAAAALVSTLILRAARTPPSMVSAAAMTSAYGNVGNAGLAISVFAFGQDVLPAAGVFMLAINATGMMLGVGLAQRRRSSVSSAVAKALAAPMTVASALALGANGAQVVPPPLFERSIGLLSGALIPLMLFTLGLQLHHSGRFQVTFPIAVSTVAKLVVAPAVATAVALAIGLSGDLAAVTAVQSAMPPAVFCMVVAIEHDLEPEAVTSTVVFATLASLVTLPVVLLLLPGVLA